MHYPSSELCQNNKKEFFPAFYKHSIHYAYKQMSQCLRLNAHCFSDLQVDELFNYECKTKTAAYVWHTR